MANITNTSSPMLEFLVAQDAPLPLSAYGFMYDREKFYVWIRAGLKAQRVGRSWRVRPSVFFEWIERITTDTKLPLQQVLASEHFSRDS